MSSNYFYTDSDGKLKKYITCIDCRAVFVQRDIGIKVENYGTITTPIYYCTSCAKVKFYSLKSNKSSSNPKIRNHKYEKISSISSSKRYYKIKTLIHAEINNELLGKMLTPLPDIDDYSIIILEGVDEKYYCTITEKDINEHIDDYNNKKCTGVRTSSIPVKLVYKRKINNIKDANEALDLVKRMTREKKLKLISNYNHTIKEKENVERNQEQSIESVSHSEDGQRTECTSGDKVGKRETEIGIS